MKKQTYTTPELELVTFAASDIITLSNPEGDNEGSGSMDDKEE